MPASPSSANSGDRGKCRLTLSGFPHSIRDAVLVAIHSQPSQMRRVPLVALACALATSSAASQRPAIPTLPFALVVPDTTRVYRFDIPAQSLIDALADFARQAGVRVELADADAPAARTAGVAGSLTA